MSSTNEHLPPPSKPRLSPLEFRNTDLVSRLLAATPPYLYNMSLLPNTYFFSEMLRSFVQAKAERNSAMLHPPLRRSRKRTWSSTRTETCSKANVEAKTEEKQDSPVDWMIKSNKKSEENPLELTNKADVPETVTYHNSQPPPPKVETSISSDQIYRNLHPTLPQESNGANLVLPPPPPMWYPPLYPAPPYGIDPLHFFIDLRVSGHIYDGKNQKDNPSPSESFAVPSPKENPRNDNVEIKNENGNTNSIFKQPRHCSAFSVPVPSKAKGSTPINLEKNKTMKFDVKSMGFDKNTNKTSTNYIMGNINDIYRNVTGTNSRSEVDVFEGDGTREETEEEREKRVKDLKALIGLELVVDYMKQKPDRGQLSESVSSTDVESIGSPALEVVALNDEN
ncbi:hypothetical protein NQ315_011555 [Exocentrus adspersus]|uniref:Uncharacterized protein n=1 Tax=Exocentrus adspersus TaxID=1586481 RepID=A0AAV8VUZ1_9CUCU|nr:hypothetical protein NQ315_011555 [Exocentrus adspersus]